MAHILYMSSEIGIINCMSANNVKKTDIETGGMEMFVSLSAMIEENVNEGGNLSQSSTLTQEDRTVEPEMNTLKR